MEMKYDSYYEKEIPYTMTLEELHARGKERNGFMTEEDILAYIRYRGKDFCCRAMSATKGISSPIGIICSSEDEKMVLCRLVTEKDGEKYKSSSYNPMITEDPEGKAWYSSYKLSLTPIKFNGVIDSWYVSDFCSAINSGHIELWEKE
jgi:hypothetical protein